MIYVLRQSMKLLLLGILAIDAMTTSAAELNVRAFRRKGRRYY